MKKLFKKFAPVKKYEFPRFICTAILMFLVAYVHSVLHIAKDALVISHLGAESISAIKLWAILPTSLVFMFIYIKLSDKFSRATLFHITTWFFVSYFILFAVFIYPNGDSLVININGDIASRFSSFRYLFRIISNWHYALFYVFSEAWVVIMLTVSFWQTANHITKIEESRRFYPLFGISAGVGKMFASVLSANFVAKGMNWQPTLNNVTTSILIAGIGISISVIVLEKIVGKETFNLKRGHFTSKKKTGFIESLKYILSSRIILLITSLLLCYSISINLTEGVWKKSIEVLFLNNANNIHHFISKVDICISTLSIVTAFFGAYLLSAIKWRTSALITPTVVLITGGIFFTFLFMRDMTWFVAFKVSSIAIAVYFGAAYNIFSRSSKHVLFDPTKEMLYIPLDDDLQTKGKAAAETIGLRFGKGGGALIQQILLGLFPALTLLELAPIICCIFVVIMSWWFYSVILLSRERTIT